MDYEVPALFGGSLERAEAHFRKGLALDPHFTALRIGLARVLRRQKRVADARRELQLLLDETAPTNPAEGRCGRVTRLGCRPVPILEVTRGSDAAGDLPAVVGTRTES